MIQPRQAILINSLSSHASYSPITFGKIGLQKEIRCTREWWSKRVRIGISFKVAHGHTILSSNSLSKSSHNPDWLTAWPGQCRRNRGMRKAGKTATQGPFSQLLMPFASAMACAKLTTHPRRIFNSGSPYNVPAGSSANLDELKAHYQRKEAEAEEKRMVRLVAEEGDSDILAQRREGDSRSSGRRTSVSSILEGMGLKRP